MKYFCYLSIFIALIANFSFAKTEKLTVAVFLEPPFVNLVEGKLVGENVEIVHFLADSIGLEPVFIQCPPIRCLTMVQQGQADMFVGLGRSPSREKDFIFLQPAYLFQQQPLRFFTLNKNNIAIKSFSDLKPLLVGTLRGAIYFPLFDNDKIIKKVELTSREQLVNMLLKGRIDTFLEREETVLPLITSDEYNDKITVADYQYNKPINSYIVLSKKSNIHVYEQKLSNELAKITADGTVAKIRLENRKKFSKKAH